MTVRFGRLLTFRTTTTGRWCDAVQLVRRPETSKNDTPFQNIVCAVMICQIIKQMGWGGVGANIEGTHRGTKVKHSQHKILIRGVLISIPLYSE